LGKANPIAWPFDLHYVVPVCGAVIGKQRSRKKIAVVASTVLMPMGLGMAGAQQSSSVEQNKKGVVMKGFVQDIEDLASNRFETSRSIPVHEDTAMPREVTGTLVPRVQSF
jgi:hypothetical protein